MKKYLLILGVVSLMIIGMSSSAFSYSFGIEDFSLYKGEYYDYGTQGYYDAADDLIIDPAQGDYIGTAYGENDDVDTLTAFLIYFGWSAPVITFFGKDETGEILTPDTQAIYDDDEVFEGNISGTWEVADTNPAVVEFIIVKGATSFSVHQYDPAVSSGEWNVGYLDDVGTVSPIPHPPTLSHLSAYNASPVPEPSTILLMGLGLLGLIGIKSRKKRS